MRSGSIFRSVENTLLFRRVRNRLNRRLTAFFQTAVLAGRKDIAVLEAACGSGYATELLASDERVRLSVGLDLSLDIHRRSGARLRRGRMVIGDIYALPFRDGAFDLVWNSSSVEELPDPQAAVGAMARVAGKGGYVFVGVPYLFGPLGIYHLIPIRSFRRWLGKPFSGRGLQKLFLRDKLVIVGGIRYMAGCFVGLLARKPYL